MKKRLLGRSHHNRTHTPPPPSDPAGTWRYRADTLVRKSDGVTPCADGDLVYYWREKNLTGVDLTAAGGNTTWVANARNGQPAVRFSGMGEYLETAIFGAQAVGTVIMALKIVNTTITTQALFDGLGRQIAYFLVSDNFQLYAGVGFDTGIAVSPWDNVATVIGVRFAGTASSLFTRGGMVGAAAIGDCGNSSITNFIVGADATGVSPLSADVYEIVRFPTVLSDADFQAEVHAQATRYAPISAP